MTQLTLRIRNTKRSHATWKYLLQSPSKVTADIGDTMMNFLTNRVEFDEEYIDSEIKTIFIDGKPVDDLNTAIIPANARIALGAVAPGVAGITMRRNSPISSMRSGITYHNTEPAQEITEGTVTLLLFNSIMEDKGLNILKKGISIPASKLEAAVEEVPESISTASLDGTSISVAELLQWIRKNPQSQVQLRVNSHS
ncbi:hypothetical protein [Halodesulfovibrio marinisediminis]|uniref:Uncharacterized protein n=1 Tax=Halodesulfovibrio marinisediminis DSM 17456 TaxID=1121457 RepID=A0A1N6DG05_9BACT|nr:hypothetical protein [Halodesulfovibrio marinisediminis]SIN69613.1 hypothetical protein SAMN02745161_0100 [Halodesulfovibrio marinisediminis DSM 17456]